jgi:hypothetical protein
MTSTRRSGSGGRRTWVAVGLAIATLVLAVVAVLALLASGLLTPRHTITGDYILVDTVQDPLLIAADGSGCRGANGYEDIGPGTPVTLRDGAGALLGTATLSAGKASATECDFTFSIPDVPEVDAYTVEVSHRGRVTNTLADMKEHDWAFALSLGS